MEPIIKPIRHRNATNPVKPFVAKHLQLAARREVFSRLRNSGSMSVPLGALRLSRFCGPCPEGIPSPHLTLPRSSAAASHR
jgi:hypothetical protein